MTSSNGKGREAERKAIQILERLGYVVHRTVRVSIFRRGRWFSQRNDVFGCIDLLAKRRGERMRYIQVTMGGGIGAKRRELATVPWDVEHESVEIWRWIGGAGKRKDARNGKPRPRLYFQVYRLDAAFALNKTDRIPYEDDSLAPCAELPPKESHHAGTHQALDTVELG